MTKTVELNVQLTMSRTNMLLLIQLIKKLEATYSGEGGYYDEHDAALELTDLLHQLLPEALWE